jgi:hypothetical protein
MKEHAQNTMYTPSTQMNKIFDLGNTIWEKTQWKVRLMLCSLFFSYKNEHTKE